MGNPPSLGVDLASTGDFLEELVLCRERAGREADNVSHLARDSAIVRGFHLGPGIDWFAAYECPPGELQPFTRTLHHAHGARGNIAEQHSVRRTRDRTDPRCNRLLRPGPKRGGDVGSR